MAITATFRKHSRILVLVFMSVLMVVFVIGDALGRGCGRADMTNQLIGTAYGIPVREADIRHTARLLEAAEMLGQQRLAPLGQQGGFEQAIGSHLLVLEARQVGVSISDERIARLLGQMGVTDQHIENVRARTGLSLSGVYEAVRTALAVQGSMYLQVEALGAESLPALQKDYRDNNQEATVVVSVIDGRALADNVEAPTEEQIAALFEAGKDRTTAHTPEALVFGYRQPDRVRIEYMTLDPESIREQVLVKDREVRSHFDQHQQKYWKTPEGGDGQPIPTTYEEVRDQVREDYRAVKAVEEAQGFINRLREEAARPWRSPATGAGQPTSLPADQVISLAALAAEHNAEFAVTPVTSELVTRQEISRLDGIGRARATLGRRTFGLSELAFNAEGMASTPLAEDPRPLLRVGEPGPVLISTKPDSTGQPMPDRAWLFRVVEAAPAGPPADLSAVREQVERDAKDERAYAKAGELANQLVEQARAAGLAQAVAGASDLKALLTPTDTTTAPATPDALTLLGPIEPKRFARRPSMIEQVGFVPELNKRVFELIDSGADLTQPQVVAVGDPGGLRWIVAQVTGLKPLYEGPFREYLQQMLPRLRSQQAQQMFMSWLNYESIVTRTGFIDQRPAADVEPASEPSAAAATR